jgi:hypothetical protein
MQHKTQKFWGKEGDAAIHGGEKKNLRKNTRKALTKKLKNCNFIILEVYDEETYFFNLSFLFSLCGFCSDY